MGLVQRDYMLWLAQRLAQALGRILSLKRSGDLDEALHEAGIALDEILGPLRRTLELIDPQSAVKLLSERDKVEAYSRIVAEEASIHSMRDDHAAARARAGRALTLLLEARLQGHQLSSEAGETLAVLRTLVDESRLPERYRELL